MDNQTDIPHHVYTLLALEHESSQREVAQSSYKRPFEESRRELIARLLDPVLSLEETARILNVCPATVRRYTNKGMLKYYRKDVEHSVTGGANRETRQRRFRLSDVLGFLEERASQTGEAIFTEQTSSSA